VLLALQRAGIGLNLLDTNCRSCHAWPHVVTQLWSCDVATCGHIHRGQPPLDHGEMHVVLAHDLHCPVTPTDGQIGLFSGMKCWPTCA
jgi:hypothetical protein